MNLPFLKTQDMLELENHAMKDYGVSIDFMMKKAGRAIYDLIKKEILNGKVAPQVLVVAGKGNNGGDALVAARLLQQDLIYTEILTPYTKKDFSSATLAELEKCESVGIHINLAIESPHWDKLDLIVDGLFGFSLKGDPRSPAKEVIEQILCSSVPVLAVDVPSGLNVSDGSTGSPAVKANYTLAYGMPKLGLELFSKLYLGDIGIPAEAYKDKGYEVPDFAGKSYIPLV